MSASQASVKSCEWMQSAERWVEGGSKAYLCDTDPDSPWTDPEEEDAAVVDTLEQRAAERDRKKKRRSRLNVFRSLGSSHHAVFEEQQGERASSGSSSGGGDAREKKSRAISPSLPINKNPAPAQFEKQRRKLISPPPPAISPSIQPLQHRLALAAASAQHQPSFASTSENAGQDSPVVPLSKPLAIRKPLVLGERGDDEMIGVGPATQQSNANEGRPPTLRVPAIVNATPRQSFKEDRPAAAAILDWKEEGSAEGADEDEDDDGEGTEASSSDVKEEDLNQDCVCADCEAKMLAALDPTYSTPWTRPARKKYLTDLKQAQIEGTKAIPKLPTLLGSDSVAVEAATSSVAKPIKADEVDAKKGTNKIAVVPMNASADAVGQRAMEDIDASLKKDVEQELRLRREEQQAKNSRNEMRRLSNDTASGLRTGGGGARAMMRQLEEADRQEKRASLIRSTSKGSSGPHVDKEEGRPMGAVKDTVIEPFTMPRRLSDNNMSPGSPTVSLPRTPSPSKELQKRKVVSPSKEELEKDRDREHRHPSPSLLIRRELTLGIPIHSNTNLQKTTAWPNHPPTHPPSPRLANPTKLEDIAEIPASTNASSTPASTAPRRAHTIGHQPNSKRVTATSTPPNGEAKVKRSNSLTGHSATRKSIDNSTRSGLGVNLSHHAVQSANEGRFGQARHKARSSFKDLVARIKS